VSINVGIKLANQHHEGGIIAQMIMNKVLAVPSENRGVESVSTSVSKSRRWRKRWLWMLVVSLIITQWDIIFPTVTVHYSQEAKEELKYIWNVQHRIFKGRMQPGGGTRDYGFLFPDERFFMEISWWNDKDLRHCVNITPTWSNTHIYLDANGDIDRSEGSGTDSDRLKQCVTDTATP
jgi:hypothetical protein